MVALEEAAKLNPLSDRPYLVEGSIALRFGDLARAKNAFSQALGRVPDDAYAALELGAIASQSGERARALALLERAVRSTHAIRWLVRPGPPCAPANA